MSGVGVVVVVINTNNHNKKMLTQLVDQITEKQSLGGPAYLESYSKCSHKHRKSIKIVIEKG